MERILAITVGTSQVETCSGPNNNKSLQQTTLSTKNFK